MTVAAFQAMVDGHPVAGRLRSWRERQRATRDLERAIRREYELGAALIDDRPPVSHRAIDAAIDAALDAAARVREWSG